MEVKLEVKLVSGKHHILGRAPARGNDGSGDSNPLPTDTACRCMSPAHAAVDVTQAASQVGRLIHEACDLNLPVDPGVRDGRTALVQWGVVLLEGLIS